MCSLRVAGGIGTAVTRFAWLWQGKAAESRSVTGNVVSVKAEWDDDHSPVGPQGCAAVAVTVPRGLPEPGPGDGRGLKAPGGLGSRFLQEDVLRLS